jgi:hypothetical protein
VAVCKGLAGEQTGRLQNTFSYQAVAAFFAQTL